MLQLDAGCCLKQRVLIKTHEALKRVRNWKSTFCYEHTEALDELRHKWNTMRDRTDGDGTRLLL